MQFQEQLLNKKLNNNKLKVIYNAKSVVNLFNLQFLNLWFITIIIKIINV